MTKENYEFIFNGVLELEESTNSSAILSGIFLKLNKITNNARQYQVEEGQQIADGLLGMPVYFGAKPVFFPGTGILMGNRHNKNPENRIGRVFKTVFDKATDLIRGSIEVFNTKMFPDIVQKIKKGWGFSIGGKALDLQPTGLLNKFRKQIMRVVGMKPHHLQLLPPEIKRGQEDAQVEDVKEVEEVMQFSPCPPWGDCVIEESSNGVFNVEDLIKLESTTDDTSTIPDEALTNEPEKTYIIHKKIIKKFIYTNDPDTIVV